MLQCIFLCVFLGFFLKLFSIFSKSVSENASPKGVSSTEVSFRCVCVIVQLVHISQVCHPCRCYVDWCDVAIVRSVFVKWHSDESVGSKPQEVCLSFVIKFSLPSKTQGIRKFPGNDVAFLFLRCVFQLVCSFVDGSPWSLSCDGI